MHEKLWGATKRFTDVHNKAILALTIIVSKVWTKDLELSQNLNNGEDSNWIMQRINAMYTESSYALSYSPENIKNYYLQNLTGK